MIHSVPQTYRGTRFRSTLEADWACTLDAYRIAWQYEPEAYQLPQSGQFYRPDFYLPEIRTWLEVKGPHDQRLDKAIELRWAVTCSPECTDSCDSIDHRGSRNPWRMVVIGGVADSFGTLPAWVPGVSSVEARCRACGRWQWSTFFVGAVCRACGVCDVDVYAGWRYMPREDYCSSGLILRRVPRRPVVA